MPLEQKNYFKTVLYVLHLYPNSFTFLEKGKHRSTISLNSSTPKHIPKMKTGNGILAIATSAVLFVIVESGDQVPIN